MKKLAKKGGNIYDKKDIKNRHHGNDSDFTNDINLVVGYEEDIA